VPGQVDAIAAALAEAGVRVEDLRRIVVTHQDIDHVGSLHDLVAASGARVLAHAVEAPFVDGTELPRFAVPQALERHPELRPIVEGFRWTPVDEALRDGARLDLAGGVRVVPTPGHTVGHVCLYLERSRTLIAGDALSASDGRLAGPNQDATPDLPAAARSVARLSELCDRRSPCRRVRPVQADHQEGFHRRLLLPLFGPVQGLVRRHRG